MHHPLFLIGSFGTTEILLIIFVIVLLFGAKRIPELFRGMGQGVREFKDATNNKENQPQYCDPGTPPAPQTPYQQPPQAPYQQQQPYPQQPQAPYQQPVNPNDSQAPRV